MRTADALECRLVAGLDPMASLWRGFAVSKPCAYTAFVEGKPEAMFGVAPCEVPGRGSVWLLGTDVCARRAKDLTRASMLWLPRLAQGFEELGNYVHSKNVVHVRWLEALGFTCLREIPDFGPERVPFKEFSIPCASLPS